MIVVTGLSLMLRTARSSAVPEPGNFESMSTGGGHKSEACAGRWNRYVANAYEGSTAAKREEIVSDALSLDWRLLERLLNCSKPGARQS
jgi:hypothetical protein